jgi:hypothetical protein
LEESGQHLINGANVRLVGGSACGMGEKRLMRTYEMSVHLPNDIPASRKGVGTYNKKPKKKKGG